jgi:integrase
MRYASAKRSFLLLRKDGSIHYWFSKFLTDKFSNANTRELVAQSLRIAYRFLSAQNIELAVRVSEGRCLTYDEAKSLGDLCWRPILEVETMGDRKLRLISSPMAGKAPKDLPNAVEPNTALKRLHHIAQAIEFYREVFVDPRMPVSAQREQLRSAYDDTCKQLRTVIRGTKQNHHLAIKSLPIDKYLSIIETVFTRPDDLFQSEEGKTSRTVIRDRALTLLACEGLRPGTLGNIALRDFRPNTGHLVITDNRSKRIERVTTNTPVLKLGDSTQVNSGSETMIQLWPFTVRALQDYINSERSLVLLKRMSNRSNGFLFLSESGGPIKHRSSITNMFNKLGQRLSFMGLLDVSNDPHITQQKQYSFYGYVLRHSAASFFLAEKTREIAEKDGVNTPRDFKDVPERVKDLMKLRFGWTINSKMPEYYAARALADAANVVLLEFNQRLIDAVQENRNKVRSDI